MERIDDECHRYERHNLTQRLKQHQQQHQYNQLQHQTCIGHNANHTCNHSSSIPVQPIDTVHALHQTIVHLRDALDAANHEIVTLKKQITVNDDIELGKQYRGLSCQRQQHRHHSSNPSLGHEPTIDTSANHTKTLHRVYEIQVQRTSPTKSTKEQFIHNSNDLKQTADCQQQQHSSSARSTETSGKTAVIETNQSAPVRQMASKIDVKIKLTSNFEVDGSESSSETTGHTTSESATPRDITSSSDITADKVTEVIGISDAGDDDDGDDDEGAVGGVDDDSVFVDEVTDEKKTIIAERSPHRLSSDNQEEVDDIELIFSSDDKELPQEDLVSISYYEPWHAVGQSGTPILVGFNRLESDTERTVDHDEKTHQSNLSPSPIDPDQFYKAIKKSVEEHEQQRQFDSCVHSVDNLDIGEDQKLPANFYSKNAQSFEKCADDESDMKRDESFDTFEMEQLPAYHMSRRWTNFNVWQETDISKIGVIEEDTGSNDGSGGSDKGRRNTCPNPAPYRPIIHREALGRTINQTTALRCPLAVKFARNARTNIIGSNANRSNQSNDIDGIRSKRNTSAQTEISALPEHWRSESHLVTGLFNDGFYTLPSKFVPAPNASSCKRPLKVSEKTREARRVLLSDINFTSMVPELSRSADHLCHGEEQQSIDHNNGDAESYAKGPFLKTPDFMNQGMTPSMSLTSPGVSQWTVNENSYGTQTTQTDNHWSVQHGDSFESYKSYSTNAYGSGSKLSMGKHNRSRSCPSVRCALCKHRHYGGLRISESMHYTPRVTFQDTKSTASRGSLPDLARPDCACGCQLTRGARRRVAHQICESFDSGSSLDEANDLLRESVDILPRDVEHCQFVPRRSSENDIQNKTLKDLSSHSHRVPFLPKTWNCLKPGYMAKVINKNGRIAMGRVRYVGPMVSESMPSVPDDEMFVGLQMFGENAGDCNGSFEGRKFFDCEPQRGLFVPFKKVVMAWNSGLQ